MPRTYFERSDAIAAVAEVFRDLGYDGTSLSEITKRTGLAKGSLYHFFPGGKEEMASETLAHIDAWFTREVFRPLERDNSELAIARMWASVDDYFRSGKRVCLIGAFALDETRNRFAKPIRSYFKRWIEALTGALVRAGLNVSAAQRLSEDAVAGIQGALTLARALNDGAFFTRTIRRLKERTDAAVRGDEAAIRC